MAKNGPSAGKDALSGQRAHWEATFSLHPEIFGESPSEAARKAAEVFHQANKVSILELGAGQGQDTLYFAQSHFQVCALDYTASGLAAIRSKAAALGLSESVSTACHDIRNPLPFSDHHFDGCYSHMLFCMALTTAELEHLSREVRRVLSPGGLCIYTVRHTGDAHYRTGIHRGEDMYEVGGFIVHFFDRSQVSPRQAWRPLDHVIVPFLSALAMRRVVRFKSSNDSFAPEPDGGLQLRVGLGGTLDGPMVSP
jgi:SAM-dependent methyltransferase